MKVARIAAGFALLVAGGVLALPGVPGPGIVLVLLGLTLLSPHFAWAERLKQRISDAGHKLVDRVRRPEKQR